MLYIYIYIYIYICILYIILGIYIYIVPSQVNRAISALIGNNQEPTLSTASNTG